MAVVLGVRFDESGAWGPQPADVTVAVEWFSAAAWGGSEKAELRVEGPVAGVEAAVGWLRRGVEVRNEHGSLVWSGFVQEVRLRQRERTVTVSLLELANRVKVVYTAPNAEDAAETEWAEDYDSIARYGTVERVESGGSEMTLDEAARLRDEVLAQRAAPALGLAADGGEGEVSALLMCVGWWSTLGWLFYERTGGRVEFAEGGGVTHPVGWALTSDQVGFWYKYLFHTPALLSGLQVGMQVWVSGSDDNERIYTIVKRATDAYVSVTADTIMFEEDDDIRDAAPGNLGVFRSPGMIRISGDGANNGFRIIEQVSATYLNVEQAFGGIVNYGAGPAITIEQGHHVEVTPRTTTETPGALVSLTTASTVAQAWRMPAGESWWLGSVWLRLRRVGTPAAGVTVDVRADSGGLPASTLTTATLAAGSAPETLQWVQVLFDNSWAPVADTVYWVVVSTTGGAADAYYEVDLDDETLAPEGEARLWDGSSWIAVTPAAASLLFKVWGAEDVTVILADVLGRNPLFSLVDVQAVGGVWRNPYATGDLSLLAAAEKLLALGTGGGARLTAEVAANQAVVVRSVAGAANTDWHWTDDSRLVAPGGGECETGWLPVGRFVWVDGLPRALGAQAVFVERAEFDGQTGRVRLMPAAALDPLRGRRFELG